MVKIKYFICLNSHEGIDFKCYYLSKIKRRTPNMMHFNNCVSRCLPQYKSQTTLQSHAGYPFPDGWVNRVYTDGIVFRHKEEQNCDIYKKIGGTGDHNVTQNKPDSDTYCIFFLFRMKSTG